MEWCSPNPPGGLETFLGAKSSNLIPTDECLQPGPSWTWGDFFFGEVWHGKEGDANRNDSQECEMDCVHHQSSPGNRVAQGCGLWQYRERSAAELYDDSLPERWSMGAGPLSLCRFFFSSLLPVFQWFLMSPRVSSLVLWSLVPWGSDALSQPERLQLFDRRMLRMVPSIQLSHWHAV